MDTALPQKFPFILDRNLAKANCTGNRVCTSCDTVVFVSRLLRDLFLIFGESSFFNVLLISSTPTGREDEHCPDEVLLVQHRLRGLLRAGDEGQQHLHRHVNLKGKGEVNGNRETHFCNVSKTATNKNVSTRKEISVKKKNIEVKVKMEPCWKFVYISRNRFWTLEFELSLHHF